MSPEFNTGRHSEDEARYLTKVFVECGRYYAGVEELRQPALRSYVPDIESMRGDYAEIFGLVDNLRDQFYERIPDMKSDIHMPSLDDFIQNRRQAIEQLKLLPLREFGVIVDETFPLTYAEQWYARTVGAVLFQDEFHGSSCQTILYKDRPMSCRHSAECPQKFLLHSLITPAAVAEREDLMYFIDPERLRGVVEMKLGVAVKKGLEDRMRAYALLGDYDARTYQGPPGHVI